ncbi:hypothetical protein [Nonomuraea guangzhouensis]|uniref:Uncharacterized protein n=1 Tax=Nonomuraea guangzhouensis TaxID=1291555 RepID=A0ABW4GGC3_9ACTN|nr:hypothetical protein [Nonomuraea guangzhouensis]
MTRKLEDDLHRVIGSASERAPHAPIDFSARIAARSRRRRTRGQALVAAVAVVIVAGGIGLVARGTSDDSAPIAVRPAQTPASSSTLPDPIEKVWPEAVWKIPAKLPGGRKFQPRAFIDDHTLLLETWESFEKADAVYAYDLDTGQTRKITDISTPKGVYASGYVVGGGRIVWQTIENMRTRFWYVPVSGGEPAAIDTDRAVEGRGDELAVVGDKLAFSLHEGGVFTVPLGGGTVTPVAGADRHHILRWPWVGTPGEYTPDNEPSFEELLNVETGQTSKAVIHPGEQNVRCGVLTCVGRRPGQSPFYRLRDSSQERELPDSTLGLAYDRFMTVPLGQPHGGQALLDLASGKSADLGLRLNAKGEGSSIQPGPTGDGLVAYELKDQYVIIDLTKIR